ncbi:MAG: TSCPD domain-containing protein [Lachnospiraceae bacterium]|nr:TSCPD domain-containing protein [Lachnospiraceae bacterium]
MFGYDYKTDNTCFQMISLDIAGNTGHNARSIGGCNENRKAVPILIGDRTVKQV